MISSKQFSQVYFRKQGTPYNAFKADVWACGITLYAMAMRYNPFDPKNSRGKKLDFLKAYCILGRDGRDRNVIFDEFEGGSLVTPELRDLILKMLEPRPSDRITMEDVLKHPFVTGESFKKESVVNAHPKASTVKSAPAAAKRRQKREVTDPADDFKHAKKPRRSPRGHGKLCPLSPNHQEALDSTTNAP